MQEPKPKESYMWGRYLRGHLVSKPVCKVWHLCQVEIRLQASVFHCCIRSPCVLQLPSRLGPRTSEASKQYVITRSLLLVATIAITITVSGCFRCCQCGDGDDGNDDDGGSDDVVGHGGDDDDHHHGSTPYFGGPDNGDPAI